MRGYLLAASALYETLAISVPTVVDALTRNMTRARGDARLNAWSERLLAHAQVQLKTQGREHIEAGKAYVVMSNHASLYDIPLLFQAFPGSLRMVTKIELFRVPLWGRAMRDAGFIAIDRKNREAAIASLNEAKKSLAQGVSVWIAPEGTRSATGELLAFKKGGFVLAQETGLSILPVGIVHARDILPKQTASVRAGVQVEVRFGAPIASTGDRGVLMQSVRERIAGLMQNRGGET